jgi:hypothetical protein
MYCASVTPPKPVGDHLPIDLRLLRELAINEIESHGTLCFVSRQ